jgi:L-alanine-DL-glutamate epimerase-like enolase superfamily enzyme
MNWRCAFRYASGWALTILCLPAYPQVPSDPSFRISVNLVQVDAVVTDSKGNHVRNLEGADFRVFEDGKPRKITSFSFVESEIPIAGGENSRWLHEYLWMLQQGVYDILQPETMAAEGITGVRKILTLAQAFGRQMTPHCAIADLGTVAALHLVASSAGPDWLEIIHDPPVCSYEDRFSIFQNPPRLHENGKLGIPQGPGLGVEIRPDLILAA